MPLIRRIPKRGFNNTRHATVYVPVNLSDLNRFEEGARVDELALKSVGLANGKAHGVKILGTGDLSKKLTVIASAFSSSAREKIEAKGGTCEVVQKAAPKVEKSEKTSKSTKGSKADKAMDSKAAASK